MGRLRSIKMYFLLHVGAFLNDFMDLAEAELAKPAKDIVLTRLQHLLELSVRTSAAASDPFKVRASCPQPGSSPPPPRSLSSVNRTTYRARWRPPRSFTTLKSSTALAPASQMHHPRQRRRPLCRSRYQRGARTVDAALAASHVALFVWLVQGLDVFALEYKVQWPLTIVLSRHTLTKYQLLFRHLFFCKHVERKLCNTWLSHQATKELDVRGVFTRWQTLRFRMWHLVHNLNDAMMTEGLEPRWHEMETKMASAKNIDQVCVCV